MQVDFQLSRPPEKARIVVAMSGGVDSSVVAALAARSGAEVIGVTLQLYDYGAAVERAKACCAGQDIYDARAVADRLGIAHYVRRVAGPGGAKLHRAADPGRDQSYFLVATTREQLDFLRFPLGDLPKSAVREIARELELVVADKPDSQDICFVPNGDYATVVKKVRPEAAQPGEIVDLQGRVIGRHKGLIHFTVGQRRGLEIGGQAEPLYVVRLEPESRRVVVGPRLALAVGAAELAGINW